MTSEPRAKDYLWQIIVGTVSTVLGGVVLALNWTAVKAFFGDVGTWLMGTTEVYRVVMIADFLVLTAAVFSWAALWRHRSRASSAPVVAPVAKPVVTPPRLPADFDPTHLQIAIILVLMQQWQQQTSLQNVVDMVEGVKPDLLPQLGDKAHVARELEILEAANVVSVDRLPANYGYYHLTPLGRDWAIKRMETAKANMAAGGK
jgi:hypothetical protein